MVEATASVKKNTQQLKPWLVDLLILSSELCNLDRHGSLYPLVRRLIHSNSGMAQIATNSEYAEISKIQHESLKNRIGLITW
jgi:retron-type reverse transcriptase